MPIDGPVWNSNITITARTFEIVLDAGCVMDPEGNVTMVEIATFVAAGILAVVFLALEVCGKLGILSRAMVDISKLTVGVAVVSTGVFLMALPDILFGAVLVAVVILLGCLTAGAWWFFLRLFSGKTVREVWAIKDSEAQALRHSRLTAKRNANE